MDEEPTLEKRKLRRVPTAFNFQDPDERRNVAYSQRWRVIAAISIGLVLIGICVLSFYLSAESRINMSHRLPESEEQVLGVSSSEHREWREVGRCLADSEASCPANFSTRPLILVALDGMRPDYLSRKLTPALFHLANCGTRASSLIPVYPTNTFPNLYSIVTGLYPESHGIIDNKMADPDIEGEFRIGSSESFSSKWWHGEPIWNTITKQGGKSATFFWPGSDVKIQERYPTHWKLFDTSIPFENRTEQILEWLRLSEEERPAFVSLYFEEPDKSAHKHGPFSKEMNESLSRVDKMLDRLMNGLYLQNVTQCVNVIVLSDHGMAPATCGASLFLELFMKEIRERAKLFIGAVGRLSPNKAEDEMDIFRHLHCKNAKLRALTKNLVPKRYHYTNSDRIDNIILDMKPESRIVTNDTNYCLFGEHGFDNFEPSMQGIFVASGPDFKVHSTVAAFKNIEIYNLMCELLRLKPSPNNGTLGALHHLLREKSPVKPRDYLRGVLEVEDKPIMWRVKILEDIPDMEAPEVKIEVEISPGRVTEGTDILSSSLPTTLKGLDDATSSSTTKSIDSERQPKENPDIHVQGPKQATRLEKLESLQSEDRDLHTFTEEAPLTTEVEETTEQKDTSDLPVTEVMASRRKRNTRSKCSCDETFQILTQSKNGTNGEETSLYESTDKHAPWGRPEYVNSEVPNGKMRVLHHTNYLIGHLEELASSVWASFSLSEDELAAVRASRNGAQEAHSKAFDLCWLPDPRLERNSSEQCRIMVENVDYIRKNISLHHLFPEELQSEEMLFREGYLLSSAAPYQIGYREGGKGIILEALFAWTSLRGDINVVHGPVFDHNLDGNQDNLLYTSDRGHPVVPDAYFYVVTSCEGGTLPCLGRDIQVLSFVFPNTELKDNCFMSSEEYLRYHLVTVREVEVLSGVRLFQKIPPEESVRLRTEQALTIWPLGEAVAR